MAAGCSVSPQEPASPAEHRSPGADSWWPCSLTCCQLPGRGRLSRCKRTKAQIKQPTPHNTNETNSPFNENLREAAQESANPTVPGFERTGLGLGPLRHLLVGVLSGPPFL